MIVFARVSSSFLIDDLISFAHLISDGVNTDGSDDDDDDDDSCSAADSAAAAEVSSPSQ